MSMVLIKVEATSRSDWLACGSGSTKMYDLHEAVRLRRAKRSRLPPSHPARYENYASMGARRHLPRFPWGKSQWLLRWSVAHAAIW